MSNKMKPLRETKLQGLIPRSRFPEFRDAGEWEAEQLVKLISTVTPPKKLLTTSYLPKGLLPIIDQSQNYICGWTDDNEAVIKGPLPLIVFGDHTCALKIVNQPFAQGADGIKIFRGNSSINTDYLYRYLQSHPIVMKGYRRHFSILKDMKIAYPDSKSGEQQKIADCLSSVDDLITAQGQKIDALKVHKKGLIQQLFPAEGKTVPNLRFPEFRNAKEWEEKPLGQIVKFLDGQRNKPKA